MTPPAWHAYAAQALAREQDRHWKDLAVIADALRQASDDVLTIPEPFPPFEVVRVKGGFRLVRGKACLNHHEGFVCARPSGHKGKHRHSLADA